MDVTLFYSPYCRRCAAARPRIRRAVTESGRTDVSFRELDIVDHIEAAAAARVTATPALVVDGRMVLAGRITMNAVRAALAATR